MLFQKKVTTVQVGWENYQRLKLDRGQWEITTLYFLGIPIYRRYEQQTFYK